MRVRQERERPESALSQAELAERVNALGGALTRRAVMSIEKNRRRVTVDEALLIAAALGVAPTLLLAPIEDGTNPLMAIGDEVLTPDQAREWIKGNDHPFPKATVKERYAFFWEKAPDSWIRGRERLWRQAVRQKNVGNTAKVALGARALMEMVSNEAAALFWRPEGGPQ